MNLDTVLLIVAVICFALAALNVTVGRINLVALGLLALTLAELLPLG